MIHLCHGKHQEEIGLIDGGTEEEENFKEIQKHINTHGFKLSKLEKKVYSKFVQKHGDDGTKQILQSVEEMAELQKEIIKLIRYKGTNEIKYNEALENLKEELGDVINALGSLFFVLGLNPKEIHKKRIKKMWKYYSKLLVSV